MNQILNKKSRNLFVTLLIVCITSLTPFFKAGTTFASVPAQKKIQVPGYYRMALGDFEVTALYDGYLKIDHKQLFKNINASDLKKLLERMFITSQNVQTSINAYLVNTGSNLVLVDAGSAKCFGPTAGTLLESIRASGYEPSQIDTIVITHLHPDHSCGLVDTDGKMAFPNAVVRVSQAESDFWLDEKIAAKAPEEFKPFFKMARDSIQPYKTAEKFKPFAPKESLVSGLVAVPTPGHTPGHTSYQFSSKGESLLILGDIIHSYATQFPRPQIGIQYDADSKKAISKRSALFASAAKNRTWLAGEHIPFPGIGHIRAEGKGYAWVPLEYSPFGTNR